MVMAQPVAKPDVDAADGSVTLCFVRNRIASSYTLRHDDALRLLSELWDALDVDAAVEAVDPQQGLAPLSGYATAEVLK